MMANERDSGIEVVHGCSPVGDNSTLNVFSWKPLTAKLQDN